MVTPNSRPEQMKPVLEQLRVVDGRDRRTQDADSNDDAAAPCTLQERTCTCEGPRAGERSSAVFGPFRLRATERLVEKDGLPMRLGGRALDILIALVERAPEVVSKRDLIKSVWGDLVVDEGNLRYHIVALRKALGDGRRGVRYIANVAGRGYCFVSPLSRSPDGPAIRGSACIDHGSLPAPLLKLIGCDDVIQRVMIQLTAQRLVSLVGPGGIGKTAIAVQVAHGLLPEFDGDVYFVDLATLAPTASVSDALASTLGLTVDRGASLPDLLARLRERRLLLVFDNCEHVIEAVAELANQLFRAAPRIHILATSREHLRIEGERVIPPVGLSLVMLGLGGFGGIINMSYAMNSMIHNTAWVTAHFHLIFGGAVVIMYFAIAYEMWPRITGKPLVSKALARAQLWLWFWGMLITTIPWHIAGLMGQPRRVAIFDYSLPMMKPIAPFVIVSGIGGLILLASAILLIVILIRSHFGTRMLSTPLQYALAVNPPQHVPEALNGFGLWNAIVAVLMLASYGYPIGQFFFMKSHEVPAVQMTAPASAGVP